MDYSRLPAEWIQPSVFRAGNASRCRENQAARSQVASIRSVHGKRLTSSVPLEDLFNASVTANSVPHGQQRPAVRAHDSSRRVSTDCCITSFPCLSQQALVSDNNRTEERSSSVIRILRPNNYDVLSNCDSGGVDWPPVTSDDTGSCSAVAVRQSETRRHSAGTPVARSSPRLDSGRRCRPVSVMEPTSRVVLKLPPLPPARKPHRPNPTRSQLSSDDVISTTTSTTCNNDHAEGGVILRHVVHNSPQPDCTRDYNSIAVKSSDVPAVHPATPARRVQGDGGVDSSTTKTFVEPVISADDSDYSQHGGTTDANCSQRSTVCTDVGSFAERLSRLKIHYERAGHHQQPTELNASVGSCRLGDGTDVANDLPRSRESYSAQQDSIFTPLPPPPATAFFNDVGAQFSETATFENGEVLLPPPPEFDDNFTVPAPSCSAVSNPVSSSCVDGWTVDDVCSWLDSVGLRQHCASFRVEEISGSTLRGLDRSKLIDLGLTGVHDRMKFERALLKVLNS